MRAIENHLIRVREIRVIQQIEHLEPEFDVLLGRERDEPRKRHIHGPEPRAFDAAPLVVAERTGVRIRERLRVARLPARRVASMPYSATTVLPLPVGAATTT